MKNNLETNRKPQNVVLGAEVCFNEKKKSKKSKKKKHKKHVFCKHDFCFKLKTKKKRKKTGMK